MIRILWPTVRPATMKSTYFHWIHAAVDPQRIKLSVAVNTDQQRSELSEFSDVIVVGEQKKGPVYATHCLAQKVVGEPADIIMLVSDDFFSPPKWDEWLIGVFSKFDGAIVVNDGYQYGSCVTIPIMTYSTLLALNRILYHPSYIWQYSDAELFLNLKELHKLKDMRGDSNAPLFEHRHWANNKRPLDANDRPGIDAGGADEHIWRTRTQLPLAKRLSV